MANEASTPRNRLLDPVDRISEVLFGLIMVLTSTNTLSVVNAGQAETRTMIIGALGCNLAWGIIDAGMYLMGCLAERGRDLLMLRAVRQAASPDEAKRAIADALPASLASVLSAEELGSMRQKLLRLPEPPARANLTKDDALSALGVCLLVFLSTFPVVIPFLLFIGEAQPALRISNAVAITMLFLCGYAFARYTGHRPLPTGLVMVAIGSALTGIAIALGG
jgi:VIT family protein